MKHITKAASLILLLTTNYAFAETNETVDKKVKFEAKKDGGYESSARTETTTDSGTKEIVETKENVEISKDGHLTGTVKTDTLTNPKGILNESWKQEEAKNEINPDGTSKLQAHSKSVDKAGTSVDSKLKTVSKIDKDGAARTTSNLTTTVDPKGMLNKSVLETNKITEKHADGTTTDFVEKKVDGKVVEKSVN